MLCGSGGWEAYTWTGVCYAKDMNEEATFTNRCAKPGCFDRLVFGEVPADFWLEKSTTGEDKGSIRDAPTVPAYVKGDCPVQATSKCQSPSTKPRSHVHGDQILVPCWRSSYFEKRTKLSSSILVSLFETVFKTIRTRWSGAAGDCMVSERRANYVMKGRR